MIIWTTRIVQIDIETGEVLNDKRIHEMNYEIKASEKMYVKLTDDHNEIIIIKKYGPRPQQRLW